MTAPIVASGPAKLLTVALGGIDIATALGLKVSVDTFAHDTDAGVVYVMQTVAGTRSWAVVGGGGFVATTRKYEVNNQYPAQGPQTPYTTLEAALLAIATDAGEGSQNSTIVVYNGAYAPVGGVLTIPSGVSMRAVDPAHVAPFLTNGGLGVSIDAEVTLDGTTAGVVAIEGCAFLRKLTTTGALGQAILSNCYVGAAAGTSLAHHNTASFPGLTLNDSVVTGPTLLVDAITGSRMTANDTAFFAPTAADVALTLNGTANLYVAGAQASIYGQTVVGAGGSLQCDGVGSHICTASPGIVLGALATALIQNPVYFDLSPVIASGAGTLTISPITMLDSTIANRNIGTTTTNAALFTATPRAMPGASAGGAMQQGANIWLITATGNVTCNLPAINTVLDGVPIRIKSVTATGDITIHPNSVADSIDGLGAGADKTITAASGPDGAGYQTIELTPNRALSKWLSNP